MRVPSLRWQARGNHGREKELGRKVVERLTTHIRGKNHHVFFDNYFNSVVLHENLLANGIYGCGTVKSSAKSLPNQMRVTRGRKSGLRLQQGEAKTWQKNGITATVWQEKKGRKPVRLLSSNTNPNSPKTSVKRKQKDGSLKEIPCPLPARIYNEHGCSGQGRPDENSLLLCQEISPFVFGAPFHFECVCFNEGGTKP